MRLAKWRHKFSLGAVGVTSVGILSGLCFFSYFWWGTHFPHFASVRTSYRPSDIWIVDRDGHPLEAMRTSAHQRSLDWVRWAEVAPAFKELLVQSEDHRFYQHHGIDMLAGLNSLWQRVRGSSRRGGASTLSMQLVGLLRHQRGHRTLLQKGRQLVQALKLETEWSKEEILEAYSNLAPFRGELVGLRAASLGHFGKHPAGLAREEAALLVSLLRAPNASVEVVAKRACRILHSPTPTPPSPAELQEGKLQECFAINLLAQATFSRPYSLVRTRDLVPVLYRPLIEGHHQHASVLQTSLEERVQRAAMQALREQLRILHNHHVSDGAVLVLETQTGRVVAYVANAGAGIASSDQLDGIQTLRQAGSTLKPFIYGLAFDQNLLGPDSVLEDSPVDIAITAGRVYHPQNYDKVFRGLVGVGEALGSSLNVPAVRTLGLVGETPVLERLRQLGLTHLQDDEFYGPSLALGAVDVTLWELTQAYRQLALPSSPYAAKTRADIFNILALPEYRRFTFGMDSLLNLPFAAAVKTGTSKDMRDNWCLGYTNQYTVGVWVGNFSGEPMWNVSGMSGAAPIWRELMLLLHSEDQERKTKLPQTAMATTHYIAPTTSLVQHATLTRIRYPVTGMLVGLDPDIPKNLQKLPIEIENPQSGHQLIINGQNWAKAQATVLWPIHRGKFEVALKTAQGELVDAVEIVVR
jgi:penicillin-binding protein 1C